MVLITYRLLDGTWLTQDGTIHEEQPEGGFLVMDVKDMVESDPMALAHLRVTYDLGFQKLPTSDLIDSLVTELRSNTDG